MIRNTDYYYKGYDVCNKNSLEKKIMELQNPYGYNFECNLRRKVDFEKNASRTNQDCLKNKEFYGKR